MFFVIAFLILIGVALLVIEFVIIPGITIAGISGFLLVVGGLFLSYKTYGAQTGNYTLLGTVLLIGVTLYYSLRSGTWNKISLHSEIDSKVNVLNNDVIHVGDTGKAISRLAPMGKVMINGQIYEAKSVGYYIEEATEIEVIKINESNITVKPLKA
jgi:membrane-bound ClpP family serine protease